MAPKLVLLKLVEFEMATTPLPPNPGALKFGWLRMLKNSARNCILKRSLSWNSLKVEKSKRWNPGETVVDGPPPRAPKPARGMHPAGLPGIGAVAPGKPPNWQGWANAAGFPNQLSWLFESEWSPSF